MDDMFSEGAADEDSAHKHLSPDTATATSTATSNCDSAYANASANANANASASDVSAPLLVSGVRGNGVGAGARAGLRGGEDQKRPSAVAAAAAAAGAVRGSGSGSAARGVLHVQFEQKEEEREKKCELSEPREPKDLTAADAQNASSDGAVQCVSPSISFTSRSSHSSSRVEGGSSSSSSSSSSSDEDSSFEKFAEPRPPDGGWGWVVVAASFFVNLIADGITFSFGVLFVEFLHYFGEGKSKTSWIGSLFMAMPLLSGPIASFLTDRFGCRCVTIVGALMASAGFVVSSFTNSLEMLFLTFGIIAGFGLSLCYVAAVVIVAYYFDSKRSFATGLSVCGSGIGTFVFAPLTQYLLNEYGWRGTILILAGLLLNLCVCGALMRDLAWTTRSREERARKAKLERKTQRGRRRGHHKGSSIKSGRTNGSSADTVSNGAPAYLVDVEQLRKLLRTPGTTAVPLGDEGPIMGPETASRMCSSLVNLPTFVRNKENVPVEVMELLFTNSQLYKILHHNYPNLMPSRSFSDSGRLNDLQHQPLMTYPIAGVMHPIQEVGQSSENPSTELKEDLCNKLVAFNEDTQHINLENHPEESTAINGTNVEIKNGHVCGDLKKLMNGDIEHTNGKLCNSIDGQNKINGNHTFEPSNGKHIANGDIEHGNDPNHSLNLSSQNSPKKNLAPSYLRDLRVHRHSLTYRGAMLNINRYRLRASSCPDIYRNSMTTIAKEKDEWYAGLWELWYVLVDMLDFSHFSDVRFLLFAISNFLLYAWYDVPYVFVMDNATDLGYSETDASFLVGVIGILNMVGEILLGWMGDQPWMNPGLVYAGCMAGCGVVVALIPFLTVYSYKLLSVVSGLFGLLIAANYSLTSIILVELITIERFTNAYGLLLLVQGIANLIGPPLGGWLYDVTGSYDLSFYLAGLFIALSGVLLVILPSFEKYRHIRRKQHEKKAATFITPGNNNTSNSLIGKIFCCAEPGTVKPPDSVCDV